MNDVLSDDWFVRDADDWPDPWFLMIMFLSDNWLMRDYLDGGSKKPATLMNDVSSDDWFVRDADDWPDPGFLLTHDF